MENIKNILKVLTIHIRYDIIKPRTMKGDRKMEKYEVNRGFWDKQRDAYIVEVTEEFDSLVKAYEYYNTRKMDLAINEYIEIVFDHETIKFYTEGNEGER
jgi:hypothetical protein